MNGVLIWLLLGVFIVLAFLFLVAVVRMLSRAGQGESKEPLKTPGVRTIESSSHVAETGPPYGIDHRPMPSGDDIEQLLPEQMGEFRRNSLEVPDDLGANSVYANYAAGRSKLFVELGVCGDPDSARRALGRAKAETDAEFPDEQQNVSLNTEPSWLKTSNRRGAFMGWTRGGYYFSAHARGGEDDLDRFMQAFPY